MALLDAATVSDATGLDVKASGDTRDGVCERAVLVEAEAAADAEERLTAEHAATLAGYDGGTAAEQAMYDRYVRAVARIAVAIIAPTMGTFRASSKGGFVTQVGPFDARENLLTVGQATQLADTLREAAYADLARLREALAVDGGADPVPSPRVLWAV